MLWLAALLWRARLKPMHVLYGIGYSGRSLPFKGHLNRYRQPSLRDTVSNSGGSGGSG
jgi:hypothetical protein